MTATFKTDTNMKIPTGTKVKVVSLSDDCAEPSCLGKTGTVIDHAETDTGATPGDPLHYIRFEDNQVEHYWHEELEVITE
jgi:hypothetical protein